jgi:uncharacterized protein (DUF2132 family)
MEEKKTIKKPTKKKKPDPLHGITLETIVTELVNDIGFEELGLQIRIKCFNENPSIKSSLTFLRRTEWARGKVERMYIWHQRQKKKKLKLNQ